jgi:hypothetical protein
MKAALVLWLEGVIRICIRVFKTREGCAHLASPCAMSTNAQMRPLRGGTEAAQVREENNPRGGAVTP